MTLRLNQLAIGRANQLLISNLSHEFKAGSITLLRGANGSGKSTLLSTLAGDIKPLKGEITFNGADWSRSSLSELAHLRSYLQQKSDFALAFKVGELIEIVSKFCIRVNPTRPTPEILKSLGIEHLLSRSVFNLSGGELQRLSLALSLIPIVPIYLLDEPLSAQDSTHAEMCADYLARLASEGCLLIVATQPNEAWNNLESHELVLDRA